MRPFFRIEDAQPGPNHLAGVVVAPAGNQPLNQLFEMLGQRNVHQRQPAIDAIYCQSLPARSVDRAADRPDVLRSFVRSPGLRHKERISTLAIATGLLNALGPTPLNDIT